MKIHRLFREQGNDKNKDKPKAPPAKIFQTYKRLLSYASKYWLYFILGMIGTILSSSVDAGLTWSLKPILDQGFIAHDKTFIQLLPFMVLIAFFLRGVSGFMSGFYIVAIGRNVVMELRQQIFNKLLILPAKFYDHSTAGQLLSTLIYNVDQVSTASASSFLIIVRETCFILGLIVVMVSINWKLTLLFFLTAPFIAVTARYSSKKMRSYSKRIQSGMGDITHVAEEALEGYKEIRTFGGTDYEREKFFKLNSDNRRREIQLVATNQISSPLVQLIISVIIAITIYIATTSVGDVTAGGFASILASMLAILKPIKNITTVNNVIQRGVVAAEGIFELLDHAPEPDNGTQIMSRVQGLVEYKNVTFAYDKDKTVLHDIELKINPGETVALVGKSGSGKSTLVSLLPRFYDDYSGTICVDGVDTRQFKLTSLREQFASVSQNVILFNDTIANNISYGYFNKATRKDIEEAAEMAYAMEFISHLPKGLDTLIGENGVLLSGGQRQRIAIARAILKNAPILILDEATSSLDSESEKYIHTALQRLMRNRTTLVIAHRLSTIENADKIVVVDHGRIVEVGTHVQLLKAGRFYAKLHAMQFKESEHEKQERVEELV
jgi:subfamily B ATP-binding cassette protein MsbA